MTFTEQQAKWEIAMLHKRLDLLQSRTWRAEKKLNDAYWTAVVALFAPPLVILFFSFFR